MVAGKTPIIRFAALIPLLLLPVAASGIQPAGGGERDVPGTMQRIQQFQACIEQLDQSALAAIDRRSMTVDAEIRALCARGERDKAQEKAAAWAREAEAAPVVREMIRCGEIMKDRIPDFPSMGLEEEYAGRHVCDMD